MEQKEEPTGINVTNYFLYVSLSINAYVDHSIFSAMYDYYKNVRRADTFSEPNPAAIAGNTMSADLSLYIFAALSFESYANLLGELFLPELFFEKYLDRLSVIDKLSAVMEMAYSQRIDLSTEPFQTICNLKRDRDKLVHDKGKRISTKEELYHIESKNQYRTKLDKILPAMLGFGEYMNSNGCKTEFLNGIEKRRIQEWVSSKSFYMVEDGLLFAHSSFPSLHEYIHAVRNHTGFKPVNCQIDDENKMIIKGT